MGNLAERLKAERDKAGITQGELAKRVGRGKRQSLISNIEAGTYKSSPYLPEIAYALGLHAMWLKTGLGPKEIIPELRTIAPPLTLAPPNRAHETPASYNGNVVSLPKSTPLIDELNRIAAHMSDRGLQVLIYEADKIDKLYPQSQANPAS